MNATEQRDFAEAITFAQSGQKELAYEKLLALSKATGAKDPQLLLWIAFTTSDLNEAETCIMMAEMKIPEDHSITSAYAWLRAERLKPKASKAPSPPFAPKSNTQPVPIPNFQQVVPPANFNSAPIYIPPPQPTQPMFIYAPPPQRISPPQPQYQPPPVVPVYQQPVIQAAPVITSIPAPVKTKVTRKKRNYRRLIYLAIFILVFIGLVAAGIIFYAIPTIRGPEYLEYTNVSVMVDQAAPPDLIT